MKRATPAEFAETPVGRYVGGRSWLCFHAGPVSGSIVWGRVGAEDASALLALSPPTHSPAEAPHVAVFEARGVTSVDMRVYPLVHKYIDRHRDELKDKITRYALVRPDGLLGAAAAGFFAIVAPPCPTRVFGDRRDALAWLDAQGVEGELEHAERETRGEVLVPIIRDALVAALPETVPLEALARQLRTSPRTLQRRLRDEGTSFRDEVNRARALAARRLLEETTMSIAEVAFDVGYSSSTHLSYQFRRIYGVTPTVWRARREA